MEKLSRYFRERVKNLSELKKCGVNVYPNFVATMSLRKLIEKYKDLEGGQLISLAGRVISKQKFKKFTIYHIQGGGETVQIKTEARISTTVMHGDVIGVVGSPGKKESGDFVIYPTSVQVLSPCLHYLPALPEELSSFSPGCPRDPLHYSLKPVCNYFGYKYAPEKIVTAE